MTKITGKGGISAEIVADSLSSVDGTRITTFVIEYPRIIHSEIMTHRMFSRNAASSRAIPIGRVIQQIQENCAMPVAWGANQAGMQAEKECTTPVKVKILDETDSFDERLSFYINEVPVAARRAWKMASNDAIKYAQAFSDAGYHKQIANRLLEPFQMMRTIVTSTDYENFFHLRCHKDADPTIQELANCMREAYQKNEEEGLVELLDVGEWHTPFVHHYRGVDGLSYGLSVWDEEIEGWKLDQELTLEEALKVSSSCCAQVSFRKLDTSLEKAISIYDKLVNSKPVHASALEHCATPIDYDFFQSKSWPKGITHLDRNGNYYSGNFKSFIQYRQLIPENVYKGE